MKLCTFKWKFSRISNMIPDSEAFRKKYLLKARIRLLGIYTYYRYLNETFSMETMNNHFIKY